MSPTRTTLTAVALLAAAVGCSRTQVRTHWDRSASFAGRHTYRWMPAQMWANDYRIDSRFLELLESHMTAATDRELAAKGFERRADAPTDLLVGIQATTEDRDAVSTTTQYGRHGGALWSESYEYQYRRGTILLDVVDPQTNTLLWRAVAQRVIDFDATPAQRAERIEHAVARMLADFPPR
jgi:hypothetical protein